MPTLITAAALLAPSMMNGAPRSHKPKATVTKRSPPSDLSQGDYGHCYDAYSDHVITVSH